MHMKGGNSKVGQVDHLSENFTKQFNAGALAAKADPGGRKRAPLNALLKTMAGLCLLVSTAVAQAQQILFIDKPALYFSNAYMLELQSDPPDGIEQFMALGAQLQLKIAKNRFPLEAPACKGNISIRFKPIEYAAGLISENQRTRWELLQLILNRHDTENVPVLLPVDTRQGMRQQPGGQWALNGCDVWVD
jgi:hypothetical protein